MTEQHSEKSEGIEFSVTTFLRTIDRISEWEGKIFSFLIVVATLQVCYELVLRYVFNAPTTWGLELTLYLCSTTYVMAGAYAERLDAHIKVDLFYNRWSPLTRTVIDLFLADTLLLIFCGVLVWYGGSWFWESVTQHLTSGTIWDPPIWPMRLVILVGAIFLSLSAIGKFVRDLFRIIYREKTG